MKKILLVSGSLPPIRCGVGYYTSRLSRELAAAGLEFELLSTDGVDSDSAAPLRIVPNWKIGNLPKMLSEIKQSGAGIIHIEYPAVGYRRQLGINLLPYALRLLRPGLKIIITLHEYHQSRLAGRLRNRFTAWPAHRVIVSNQPDKRLLGLRSKKVVIIPIGVNLDTAPRQPEVIEKVLKSRGLDPRRKTLVFFGYAFPAKRLELLIAGMEQPELADYQLLIFPEIDSKSAYHRHLNNEISRINKHSVRVGVQTFLGDAEASAVLQECRYFILPSEQPLSAKSGSAIAAVENGVTVISAGATQPEDNLPFIDKRNCLLLEEVTPESIAAAIGRLDTNQPELRVIEAGADELKRYFSWDNIVKQHLKIYGEL